jgi:hypothetical protein
MNHGIFRFLSTCLTASLTAFAVFPASAAGPDAPVRQYAADFGDVAAQGLTLADNGRFILSFVFSTGVSVGKINWVGNWQQKGARLCLTPDPPELLLYAHPAEARDKDGGVISLTLDDEKEKESAAFAWSRSDKMPERFLKMDLNAGFLLLPAQDGYLFVAHIPPGTGDAPLDIQRYPVSPKQGYRLRYAGIPKGSGISSAKDARQVQDSFFLMLFAEFKQMSDVFFASMSGDESETLRAVIEKQAKGTPPYCGTLDTTRMKLQSSQEDIRMTREAAAPHHLDDEEMLPYTRIAGTPMKGRKPSLDSLLRCGKGADKNREDLLEHIWNCVP